MQQLSVSLTIPIPEDSVLISKVELEELKRKELHGVFWNMRDLELRTGRKQTWLKEHLLYPERFRKRLDVENGGCVLYPQRKGQPWAFHAKEMATFLDENFHKIFASGVTG